MCLLQNNQPEPFSKLNIFAYRIPIFSKILVVESAMVFFVNIFIEIAVEVFTENKDLIIWNKKTNSNNFI